MRTRVTNLGFAAAGQEITVNSIQWTRDGEASEIAVGALDRVFVTNGSMTADKSFGTMAEPARLDRKSRSGAWQLWTKLAEGRPEFGDPGVFDGHIEESCWESFTVTTSDPLFFQLMEEFSGNEPGKGGLITLKDSSWLITLSMLAQPFFVGQPKDVSVWWGYGLFHDRTGDYVKKSLAECTGSEILEEVIGHLHFGAHKAALMAAANVIPCMMPYITSQFLVRKAGDRPLVVPEGSTNLAFLGQYAELPDDVVFTVEYSVRSAQIAVDTLLHLEQRPSPIYKGLHDPRVVFEALETLHR
jgi:oleate hydratase